jgi:GTP pyrophosphokinase
LQEGHDKLAREVRKHGIGISNAQSTRAIKSVAESLGYKDSDDMLVAIGTGKESAQHVTNRLLKLLVDRGTEEAAKPDIGQSVMSTGKMPPMLTSVNRPKRHETHSSSGVVVKGLDDVLVRLSRCCNPVLGDDIIGFVTRGRGVSVHRRDCPNAQDLMREPERIIDVSWESEAPSGDTIYNVEIMIEALDRMNLLSDVALVLSGQGANITNVNSHTHRDGMVEMRFMFQVSDTPAIQRILDKVTGVEGVFDAHRVLPSGR